MESIIKDEIIKHLNIFKLINESQHGFTKGRSSLTNLLEFFEKNFFSNRVVDAWNELPQYVIDAETVNSFKARLAKFYHKI